MQAAEAPPFQQAPQLQYVAQPLPPVGMTGVRQFTPQAASTPAQYIAGSPSLSGGSSSTHLENMSINQLQSLLDQRNQELAKIQDGAQKLQDGPSDCQERIQHLEEVFGKVQPRDVIRLKGPLVDSIMNGVESHAKRQPSPYTPEVAYVMPTNMALGRDYMPIDHMREELERLQSELWRKKHQYIQDMHWAGHIAAPLHVADSISKGADGEIVRKPLSQTAGNVGFWLDKAVCDIPGHADEVLAESDDPMMNLACRHGSSGWPLEARPTDWLGRKRRAMPIVKGGPPSDTWTLPSWMY